MRVAGVVLARNEFHRLPMCLASLAGVDGLYLGDHGSTDQTAALARRLGAEVVAVTGTLGAAREALRVAVNAPWLIVLDADERLPPGGVARIREAISHAASGVVAFRVPVRTYLGDRFLRWGGFYPARRVRVVRRDAVWWCAEEQVHESVRTQGAVETLNLPIEHHSFTDLEHLEQKWRRYAHLAGRARAAPNLAATGSRALWRWLQMFVFRGGFLMGKTGWSLAHLHAAGVFWRRRAAKEAARPDL